MAVAVPSLHPKAHASKRPVLLRWSGIRPLRHDALKAHAADMLEHGRAVTRQMLNELDRAPLGAADQSGEPPLARDQRQAWPDGQPDM